MQNPQYCRYLHNHSACIKKRPCEMPTHSAETHNARYHSASREKSRALTGTNMPSPFLRRDIRPNLHSQRPSVGSSKASSPSASDHLAPTDGSLISCFRLLFLINTFASLFWSWWYHNTWSRKMQAKNLILPPLNAININAKLFLWLQCVYGRPSFCKIFPGSHRYTKFLDP